MRTRGCQPPWSSSVSPSPSGVSVAALRGAGAFGASSAIRRVHVRRLTRCRRARVPTHLLWEPDRSGQPQHRMRPRCLSLAARQRCAHMHPLVASAGCCHIVPAAAKEFGEKLADATVFCRSWRLRRQYAIAMYVYQGRRRHCTWTRLWPRRRTRSSCARPRRPPRADHGCWAPDPKSVALRSATEFRGPTQNGVGAAKGVDDELSADTACDVP